MGGTGCVEARDESEASGEDWRMRLHEGMGVEVREGRLGWGEGKM